MKRWPIIRHVRYFWHKRRLGALLTRYGVHTYVIVSLEDMLFLADVWSGRR